MADLQTLVDQLSVLTVLEAAELSRMLEDKWGVSAAAPVVQTITQEVAPVEEAQTEFEVFLTSVAADKKIVVIKEIRAITGLGLKEAKEFTEAAGPTKLVKDSLSKIEAEALRKRLEDAGGTAMIH
jgi:large subunit ribosomal protein L7/L12